MQQKPWLLPPNKRVCVQCRQRKPSNRILKAEYLQHKTKIYFDFVLCQDCCYETK